MFDPKCASPDTVFEETLLPGVGPDTVGQCPVTQRKAFCSVLCFFFFFCPIRVPRRFNMGVCFGYIQGRKGALTWP